MHVLVQAKHKIYMYQKKYVQFLQFCGEAWLLNTIDLYDVNIAKLGKDFGLGTGYPLVFELLFSKQVNVFVIL